jgi:hypothetical protein
MPDELISKLIESFSDIERGRRAGQHWGNGGSVRHQPRRMPHPWDGIVLGNPGPVQAARDAAEQRLLCSPAANWPRWTRRHNFVVTIHPDPKRERWYAVGFIMEPWTLNRNALLEYGDHAGRQIVLVQNPGQDIRLNPVRGSEQLATVLNNNFWSFEVDLAYQKEPKLFDLIAVF